MLYITPDRFFMALGVSEMALAIFKRAKSTAKNKDSGSLAALWVAIGVSIGAAICIAFKLPQFAWDFSGPLYSLAVAFFVFGSILRWWSIVHLGRFFTVNVAIAQDHRVVDNGTPMCVTRAIPACFLLLPASVLCS